MEVSAKDFENANTILEVGEIMKDLKAKGADIRTVHMLASNRKKELLRQQQALQSLHKVNVATNISDARVSTLNLQMDTITVSNHITLTSENIIKM